jgi:putative acetyltransferase
VSANNSLIPAKGLATIRIEVPDDLAAIAATTVAAFRSAAHSSGTEQHIISALRRAGQLTVSLVAEEQGKVVGHVAVSPVTIEDGATDWYGLGPVSVLPDRQRQGLGSRLVTRALDELRGRGAKGCVVLGEPGYYARFGFRPEPGLVLPGVPSRYFQAIVLRGTAPSGRVAYHEAFEATASDGGVGL